MFKELGNWWRYFLAVYIRKTYYPMFPDENADAVIIGRPIRFTTPGHRDTTRATNKCLARAIHLDGLQANACKTLRLRHNRQTRLVTITIQPYLIPQQLPSSSRPGVEHFLCS